MDVDVAHTVEQLHRAILAVEHPNHDRAEAIATLKRLIWRKWCWSSMNPSTGAP
jgi:hypothetical protein